MRQARFATAVRLLENVDAAGLRTILHYLPAWVKLAPGSSVCCPARYCHVAAKLLLPCRFSDFEQAKCDRLLLLPALPLAGSLLTGRVCRFLNDAVRVLWPAFDRVLCQ